MSTSLLLSKVTDISDARKRRRQGAEKSMTTDNQNRRQTYRRESVERLFVQIINCEADPDLVGTTVSCQAVDISAGGLKVATERLIPAGCELDIWIDIRSRPGKFFLTSDVRWSRPGNQEGVFEFGVRLHDGAATDINEWQAINK